VYQVLRGSHLRRRRRCAASRRSSRPSVRSPSR